MCHTLKQAPKKGLIYKCHDHLYVKAYSDVVYANDKGDQKLMT